MLVSRPSSWQGTALGWKPCHTVVAVTMNPSDPQNAMLVQIMNEMQMTDTITCVGASLHRLVHAVWWCVVAVALLAGSIAVRWCLLLWPQTL